MGCARANDEERLSGDIRRSFDTLTERYAHLLESELVRDRGGESRDMDPTDTKKDAPPLVTDFGRSATP
jgi:hypothetical protein